MRWRLLAPGLIIASTLFLALALSPVAAWADEWRVERSEGSSAIVDVCVADATHVWALPAGQSTLLASRGDGAGWQTLTTDAFSSAKALCSVDADRLWAIGEHRAYATADGSQHWRREHTAIVPLTSLAFAGSHGYAGGSTGLILSCEAGDVLPAEDTDPPQTTVIGAERPWYNRAVPLTFSATDAGGQVAGLSVRLDDGPVIDAAGATQQLTIAAPSDHSGDGEHTVSYRAVDEAGNLEEWKTITVGIDTRRPTTSAPRGVGVKHTGTAEFPYKVSDPGPGAAAATVTIVVETLGGRTVKTLRLGSQPLDELLLAEFSWSLPAGFCSLPAGFYRFRVRATDAAGNSQGSTGNNVLVVTRWLKTHAFGARLIPFELLPYYSANTPVPREDTGTHDAAGVTMKLSDGMLYNYPGGQARYGLANLNSYRLTDDSFYLQRATAQAQRLLETRITYGLAWYYPQPYDRYCHGKKGDSELMRAPWYSGMAQGQVLSLMVRMYEVTGEAKYLNAARHTLYSLAQPGPASRPWVTNIDGSHHLWIQEWPKSPLDNTYNGHMIATYGLYDYYRVTKDSLALLLFRASSSTTLDYASSFRRRGRMSKYCLLHGGTNKKYHQIHIDCLLNLYTLTGDAAFARYADAFTNDYPQPEVEGYVRLSASKHTALRLGPGNSIVATRTIATSKVTRVAVSQRARRIGVIRFYITSGPLAGYWLREHPSRVYLLGKAAMRLYSPPRQITLQEGVSYTGCTYAADGSVSSKRTIRPRTTTTAYVMRRAVVNGRDRVLVSDGELEGYWLVTTGLMLDVKRIAALQLDSPVRLGWRAR